MHLPVIAALIGSVSLHLALADLTPRPFAITTNCRAPSKSIRQIFSISRGGESVDVAPLQPCPPTTQISRGGDQSPSPPPQPNSQHTEPQPSDPPQAEQMVCRGGSDDVCGSRKNISLSTKAAVLAGCTLAFNGGFVNGACLSGILSSENMKQAAAAVTGAWTNSAIGIASGNYDQFYFNVKCIVSYMTGSLVASLCNPFPTPFELSPDNVSPAFLIGSFLLFASSNIAKKSGGADRAFIYLAAIACGIQNSVTSVLTSNLVRSAHFSGITSDIGTFLGQVLRGNNQNIMKLRVFVALAASFWTGGLVSFSATTAYASSSLLFSAALFLAIATGLFFA